jgi:hypothetical protein
MISEIIYLPAPLPKVIYIHPSLPEVIQLPAPKSQHIKGI